ncbi:MAG: virulence RhuM family protein [Salinivirgaceae bacterium]|nr:virulence RhuM family protein [Salinivirgaceae bacterium]
MKTKRERSVERSEPKQCEARQSQIPKPWAKNEILHQMNTGEIIFYQPNNSSIQLDVRIEHESVWLNQLQMVELFDSTKQNLSLHINNIFKEGELDKRATVKEYLTVQKEGGRSVKRRVTYYNLDVIISVGYRVKSQRGTQFRIWATKVLRNYLLKGYAIHERFEHIEHRLTEHDKTFDLLIQCAVLPQEGIFYNGQIFDAYKFTTDLIKKAKNSIVLIDNYIDETLTSTLYTKGEE